MMTDRQYLDRAVVAAKMPIKVRVSPTMKTWFVVVKGKEPLWLDSAKEARTAYLYWLNRLLLAWAVGEMARALG